MIAKKKYENVPKHSHMCTQCNGDKPVDPTFWSARNLHRINGGRFKQVICLECNKANIEEMQAPRRQKKEHHEQCRKKICSECSGFGLANWNDRQE